MERGGAGSALFAGFRALGLFSTDVAHVLRFSALKRRFFVTTCVGKSFHTYDVSGRPRRPLPGTPRLPAPPHPPALVSPSLLHALGQPFLLPGQPLPPPPHPPPCQPASLPRAAGQAQAGHGAAGEPHGDTRFRDVTAVPHTCEGVLKVYM